MPQGDNPLIIQSDRTLLLDVHAAKAKECATALIPFAELVSSPEHLHTYRISPLSLWNAASAGFTSEMVNEVLSEYSRYEIPQAVSAWIRETEGRFGKLRLIPGPSVQNEGLKEEQLYLVSSSAIVYKEIAASPTARNFLTESLCSMSKEESDNYKLSEEERKFCFLLKLTDRGIVKEKLLQLGWPVKDDVPLKDGSPLDITLRETCLSGKPFTIRDYQKAAAEALVGNRSSGSGFGTIVLPCGAGKTIVGMEIMSMLKTNTLIVTTNISAVHQWIGELLDKTNLTEEQIAEY
ncbi:MAG: helicase-associated domain-containing protein, partial [Treponema sp.]|nr:helicase-associated domain-containing protein [Treponema sp.]